MHCADRRAACRYSVRYTIHQLIQIVARWAIGKLLWLADGRPWFGRKSMVSLVVFMVVTQQWGSKMPHHLRDSSH